jgi:A/G-specific adenine glycosylase
VRAAEDGTHASDEPFEAERLDDIGRPSPGYQRTQRSSSAHILRLAPVEDLLLAWFSEKGRDLPWRRTRDPYAILVSEVMLQQTQVERVVPRYEAWLERWPTVESLAAAHAADAIREWQGLGYNRRALNLHRAARRVAETGWPQDLTELPGVGPYTAAAIRCFAFGEDVLPVDVNVQRVRRRTGFDFASASAQALMDLGATVCRPLAPRCGGCPWRADCRARRTGMAEQLPRRAARVVRPVRRGLAFLLSRPDGAILFRRRAADGLLGGMHELPSSPWAAGPLDVADALRHAPAAADWRVRPTPVRHVFSHFVLELSLAEAATGAPPPGLWCRTDRLPELALPTVMKKLLRLAGHEIGGN